MKDRLTLTIDRKTKERAKKVAFKKGKSVSQIVEDYLKTLTELESEIPEDSIVSELSGSVPIPQEIDYNDELVNILEKKNDE